MKTLAIVGAGPNLGMSIAKQFGEHGFSVALLARDRERLEGHVRDLGNLGITAAAFPADVADSASVTTALGAAEGSLGPIDVLEYSPTSGASEVAGPLELTRENVQFQFDLTLLGAVAAVQAVLPGMRSRGSGALLFTTGASAMHPMPMMGNVGIAMAGLRNYAGTLHEVLAPEGIYAGHFSIDVVIVPGAGEVTPDARMADPDSVAAHLYAFYEERGAFEVMIGGHSANPFTLEELAAALGQSMNP